MNGERPAMDAVPTDSVGALELDIEELVLDGLAPGDRYGIGAAVERELGRLLAEQGVPGWLARGGQVERLDGGAFEMTPGTKAEVVGARVARAAYGGLTG